MLKVSFQRNIIDFKEITQVVEFYVDDETNEAKINVLYARDLMENEVYNNPTSHLIDYLASQGVMMQDDPFIPKESELQDATDSDGQKTEGNLQSEVPVQEKVNNKTTEQVTQEVVNTADNQVTTNQVPATQNIEMIEI